MTPSRRRVLMMLEQQGPLHRHRIGEAFAKKQRGITSQAATRLAGYICKPLLAGGLIHEEIDREGWHRHFSITAAGRHALRALIGA